MLKSVGEKKHLTGLTIVTAFFWCIFFLGESKNCFKVLKRCSNQLKPESVVNLKAQGVCESSFASVSFPVAAIQGSDESNVREKGFVSALH